MEESEMTIEQFIKQTKGEMKRSVDHFANELSKFRTGKASPSMVEDIKVDYYGNPTPMNQVANISAADSKSLVIQPWEKSLVPNIEQAIFAANIGLTPQNDGEVVRINIPPLTEERRKEIVKQIKKLGEDTKVSLRNARHKAIEFVRKEVKEGYPEDMGKRKEQEIQSMTDTFSKKVDQLMEAKEEDIMTL